MVAGLAEDAGSASAPAREHAQLAQGHGTGPGQPETRQTNLMVVDQREMKMGARTRDPHRM